MNVNPGNGHPQGASVPINNQASLGVVLGSIRRVGTDAIPQKRALAIAPSALCHFRCTPPSSPQFSTSLAQFCSLTPALFQPWN